MSCCEKRRHDPLSMGQRRGGQSVVMARATLEFKGSDFPGGPVAETELLMQGAPVPSLVGEVAPTSCNEEFT